jgi:hypothetical protein
LGAGAGLRTGSASGASYASAAPGSSSPGAGAAGDKEGYEKEKGPVMPPPQPTASPTKAIPEAFLQPQEPSIAGYPIAPNINTFMYYGRMVSLYGLKLKEDDDKKYLVVNDEKLMLDTVGQDVDRKSMSFKLHRALAYEGTEAYGQKPFCYSLQPANEPSKWVTVIKETYFALTTIDTAAPHEKTRKARRAASFCVTEKKSQHSIHYVNITRDMG